jgi:uncharacterized Fe-S cluster protein YjdI
MSDGIHHYADAEIEVTYEVRRCIHAAECLRGLPQVFDNSRRPWVLPNAASADAISAVVTRCPSGALQFKRLDGGPPEAPTVPTTITPIEGGPLYVRGRMELHSEDGTPIAAGPRMALCRCGKSSNKPFCDNSHFDEN